MSNFRFFLSLLVLLMLLPLPAAAMQEEPATLALQIPSGTLTLKEAHQIALAAAPGVEEALIRIQAARAVLDQARATLKPTANLYAGHRFQDSSIQPDWVPEIRVYDGFNSLNAGIQANWLIFDGFSRRALVLASQHKVDASQQFLNDARRLLAKAVSTAFYQAQLAVESMFISLQNRSFNRDLEAEADKRWQAGSIPEAEKLNFSVRALQAETDFLKAEQRFKVVSTLLAELMALPDAKLPPALYPVRSTGDALARNIPSYDVEFAHALRNRPDLQVLEFSLAALQESKKGQKGRYWPNVFLNAGIDYKKLTDLGSTDQEEHDTFAGVNLSWDLYKGGERSAKIQEIEKNILAARQQKRQKVLAIQSNIRQSIATATATRAMYERQKRALALTIRIRDHIEKAYRAGVATLTRLNEAQNDQVRSAGAAAASRINYLLALQQLDAASGRILEDLMPR